MYSNLQVTSVNYILVPPLSNLSMIGQSISTAHNALRVKEKIATAKETESLRMLKCDKGHSITKIIEKAAMKIFNIGGHNYATDENSKIHAAKQCSKRKSLTKADAKTTSAMKICKLQSDKM